MLKNILKDLNSKGVQLVAVSKTKPIEAIQEIYDAGQKVFGENRVQELVEKEAKLPKDIHWHLIGHLQTNKVKFIAPFVQMIHSIDSLKLLNEVNKQALKNDRVIDCLLQMHIADEETKFGLDEKEAVEILASEVFKKMQNVRIVGLMGMATFTSDEDKIHHEFRNLRKIFKTLKSQFFSSENSFKEISMGMSGDYKIAIEEGSTMTRIGSLIFGAR